MLIAVVDNVSKESMKMFQVTTDPTTLLYFHEAAITLIDDDRGMYAKYPILVHGSYFIAWTQVNTNVLTIAIVIAGSENDNTSKKAWAL